MEGRHVGLDFYDLLIEALSRFVRQKADVSLRITANPIQNHRICEVVLFLAIIAPTSVPHAREDCVFASLQEKGQQPYWPESRREGNQEGGRRGRHHQARGISHLQTHALQLS